MRLGISSAHITEIILAQAVESESRVFQYLRLMPPKGSPYKEYRIYTNQKEADAIMKELLQNGFWKRSRTTYSITETNTAFAANIFIIYDDWHKDIIAQMIDRTKRIDTAIKDNIGSI